MMEAARLRTLPVSILKDLPRIILIALFTFAAIDKLLHFRGFVTAIHSYGVLPNSLEYSAAIFFLMAEFAIALGLLTNRWRRVASLSAILLLSVFTIVYLAVNPAGVCGCWFTLTLNSGGYFHILQNLIFIALAILTWMDHKPSRPEASAISYSPRPSTAQSDDGRLEHA